MKQDVTISLTRDDALNFLEWTKHLPAHKILQDVIESMIWKFDIEFDENTGKYTFSEEIQE